MRLDLYLTERGLAPSRTRAKSMIENGEVWIDGKPCTKPSWEVCEPQIELHTDGISYVGRGGRKLEGALDAFSLDVGGMTAVDIGASTGGFTQCLLLRGAARVYAVDAGSGQLHPTLRLDSRVVNLENVNARDPDAIPITETCDLCVMDVSFISQTLIYPAVLRLVRREGYFLSLIKPQFEAGRAHVGKGGLVRDLSVHKRVISSLTGIAAQNDMFCHGLIPSPITGGDGNREYLALFRIGLRPDATLTAGAIHRAVYGK